MQAGILKSVVHDNAFGSVRNGQFSRPEAIGVDADGGSTGEKQRFVTGLGRRVVQRIDNDAGKGTAITAGNEKRI